MSKRAKTSHASDGDYAQYAARASAAVTDIEVDDLIRTITSRSGNAKILRRLKSSDPNLTNLDLESAGSSMNYPNTYLAEACAAPSLGWLGYFVGESKHLTSLSIDQDNVGRDELITFFRGLNRNRSVQDLTILGLGRLGAEFPALTRFFAENKNLNEVVMSAANEDLEAGTVQRLSRALRSCTSLKSFTFELEEIDESADEHVVEIINSLSEKLQLEEMGIHKCSGRRGYRALADLLAWKGSQLQSLMVEDCHMDVEDFECLLNVVASNRALEKLYMGGCRGRGSDDQATLALTRSWGSIERPLLEAFASNLVKLDITRSGGSMDDEGAIAFSHALAGNLKLKVLTADWQRLTSRGWNALSKLLCDTLSPETTYASNHTLQDLGLRVWLSDATAVMFLDELVSLLSLNRNYVKARAASAKILKSHDDFDMQVFFEWEFKMLPIAVQWLERVADPVLLNPSVDPNSQRRKLSMIYQFVRGAPKLFIEYCLRRELEEIGVREEKIRQEQENIRREHERMQQELERLQERKRSIQNNLQGD